MATRAEIVARSATISTCGRYRYDLWRRWAGDGGFVMFIGLNPSTADADQDDPTIRRCVDFAQRWGYAGLCMANLFAFRARHPRDMLTAEDPVGPENDRRVIALADQAACVVAAWGNLGRHHNRSEAMRALVPRLHYLALSKSGQPKHPLYLRRDLVPIAWG